jgi:hypothetical protein
VLDYERVSWEVEVEEVRRSARLEHEGEGEEPA